jgi:hypothetical protein
VKIGGEYPQGREVVLANMPEWFLGRSYNHSTMPNDPKLSHADERDVDGAGGAI